MKIFLSAIAILVLILTVINSIRNRFRPSPKPDNTLLGAGIVLCVVAVCGICISAYLAGNLSHLPKLIFPVFMLIILTDQYRRNSRRLKSGR